MTFDFEKKFDDSYQDYLRDESNLVGDSADVIVFPKNAEELSSFLEKNQDSIIIASGARTGVVGGAVPRKVNSKKHCIVSLTKCNQIGEIEFDSGEACIRVGAGVSFFDLEEKLTSFCSEYFFPVDPTEKWASFGGAASTNASGARSYYYSSMRKWIKSLEVVLVDGTILQLERGDRAGYDLPSIDKPKTKNSIGYFVDQTSDLIDLFVGAEGTLGIITSLVLKLERRPNQILTQLQFFSTSESALDFVNYLRGAFLNECLSIEFLDNRSVEIGLAQFKTTSDDSLSQQIEKICNQGAKFSVCAEFKISSEDEFLGIYEKISDFLAQVNESIENSICGTSDEEIKIIKKFRHSVPEGVNKAISLAKQKEPSIRKVGTDMAVPQEKLKEVYEMYDQTLSNFGIEYCILGHAGDSHFHVNLLPNTKEEMDRALELYKIFAEKIVKMGGAVSAEHGIGRIKKDFLKMQINQKEFDKFRKIKKIFDPEGRLNPGILFD